ncbi:RidA family protein [Marmoricola endophyticus]|uniref:RidA family protein n=1 Tax=Marmoricola endophyticus TaxID=2040280 RepID=UPI001E4C47F7|nr:RidA family protein [Marmoricola endophyticus]
MTASDEARRRSYYTEGFAHQNPIPAACRVGSLLMTGNIHGADPTSGEMPADVREQTRNMFGHLRTTLAAAGGSTHDVVKLTVRLRDHQDRSALNEEWLATFPDPDSRPARETLPGTTRADILVQCNAVAVLDDGSPAH